LTKNPDRTAPPRPAPRVSARNSPIHEDDARAGHVLPRTVFPLLFTPAKEPTMTIKIVPNDKGTPPGKLADAELHFTHGPLEGLKLLGFAVWERKTGSGRNVTFPSRQYAMNGERRSFALLRPIDVPTSQNRIRDLILQAYSEHEAETAVALDQARAEAS
jgi:hypothetical protein